MAYILVKSDFSRCPNCKKYVNLLSDGQLGTPMFFICWACLEVWQVGEGLVPTDSEIVPQVANEFTLRKMMMEDERKPKKKGGFLKWLSNG